MTPDDAPTVFQLTRLDRRGEMAVLTIDRPPVNAIGHALRLELDARLMEICAAEGLAGLVITCAGPTFCAGSEIAELGQPLLPSLPQVLDRLESLSIPSVAAIHGTALGGGFELALGCNARVAAAGARIGLPEVTLGFPPGAGGTVRGTYLAGAEAALELAGTGRRMPVEEALTLGLIDRVVTGDLLTEALAFLDQIAGSDHRLAPVKDRKEQNPPSDPARLSALTDELCRKARSEVPRLVARAVQGALDLPFDAAIKAERTLHLDAVATPQSAALRHMFFAERTAARPTPEIAGATAREVRKVGIVGAGTMGTGIATAFADGGYAVWLHDSAADTLDRAMSRIAETCARAADRGRITAAEAAAWLALVTPARQIEDLSDCDLLIEAAFEDMDVKGQIFARLDRVARPGAILATNTSYLDVGAIAGATGRAAEVLGLHFFSPANIMKLLEIVRHEGSAPDVIATALRVAKRLGKQPVLVGNCNGFVGNRMLRARNGALSRLILEGATPARIDRAFRAVGWAMGPCQMQDLAGLDISWRMRQAQGTADPLPDRLCEAGRFGQKAGQGWYRYVPGSREPLPDLEMAAIAESIAATEGITRREVPANEIIARTHDPMIAEGRAIVAEGIAARASDVDVVWVAGYGFPRILGGPLHWDDAGRPLPSDLDQI